MRSAALLTALFAAGAFGSPMAAPDIVTDVEVVIETVVVTKDVFVPAPTESAAHPQHHHHHHHHKKPEPQPQPQAVNPVPFAEPHKAPAPASVPQPQPAPKPQLKSKPQSQPTQQSEPAPQPQAPSGLDEYQQAVLVHHNVHRKNHSAPEIHWDARMAQIAQDEASVCIWAHNTTGGGGGYGQNIAAGIMPNNISEIITGMFYNGEVNNYAGMYGWANPNFSNLDGWGHFTQVVWKGSTGVGCATVDCSASGLANTSPLVSPYFTVCNYYPPGNMGGAYGDNVGSPVGMNSVSWAYGGF